MIWNGWLETRPAATRSGSAETCILDSSPYCVGPTQRVNSSITNSHDLKISAVNFGCPPTKPDPSKIIRYPLRRQSCATLRFSSISFSRKNRKKHRERDSEQKSTQHRCTPQFFSLGFCSKSVGFKQCSEFFVLFLESCSLFCCEGAELVERWRVSLGLIRERGMWTLTSRMRYDRFCSLILLLLW